jgi:hypothetical protein
MDTNLVQYNSTAMSNIFSQVKQDLVGDGWTVYRYDAPRHNFSNPAYTTTLQTTLKNVITNQTSAKGILIIGHVTIPYSGINPPDLHGSGNGDHQGAWPADMYFGQSNSTGWTDTANILNTINPDNANAPTDGKFDQDVAPGLPMGLFVGRVDFAGLPSFNPSGDLGVEIAMLQSYFTKAHNYRMGAMPFGNRGIVYDDAFFTLAPKPSVTTQCIYENAIRNFAAFYPNGISNLDVGDPYFQKSSRSYLWGFLSGAGQKNRIGDAYPALWPASFLEHTSADLQSGTPGGAQAKVGFYMLLGSFFGDWNMTDDFMRGTIASSNGLACVWIGSSPTQWKFHGMGLGETLGDGLLATVNNNLANGDQRTCNTIIGDPTLRLTMITPPTIQTASASSGFLSWSPGAASTFNVYGASTTSGPFTFITSATSTSTTIPANSRYPVYMVRGAQTVTSGSGSYVNLSQGSIATAQ